MAQKTRFLDNVTVNAFGNTMPEAITTASGGVGNIVFTRANGVTFTLPLAASASSADALITASVVDNVVTFTKGDLSTFSITVDTGSNSVPSTSSADLVQQLVSNQTVGAISSGTTFAAGSTIENLLRTMLITDIPSTISNLNVKNGGSTITLGILEVNTALTFNTASFSATADSPDGNFPVTSSFVASGASTGNFTFSLGNGPVVASNNLGLGGTRTLETPSLGASTQSSTTTLRVNSINPKNGASLATSKTATFVYPLYYGNSTTDFSTSGNVEGTLTKSVQTRPSQKSVALNFSGEFIYFCYPASYPDLTSILDGNGFETLSAFTKYTRNQDGAAAGWSGRPYKIYKSGTTSVPNQTFVFKF